MHPSVRGASDGQWSHSAYPGTSSSRVRIGELGDDVVVVTLIIDAFDPAQLTRMSIGEGNSQYERNGQNQSQDRRQRNLTDGVRPTSSTVDGE